MALRALPEEAVKETLEYKVLQSQFSLLYHESLQVKTQLDEARALLLATKNSHLRHIEHMEVRGTAPGWPWWSPRLLGVPRGGLLGVGVMASNCWPTKMAASILLRRWRWVMVSPRCPIGRRAHGTSWHPTVGHPRWPPPSY